MTTVGHGEFDLPIKTAGSQESRIQRVCTVRGHDDLYVDSLIETVHLIQELHKDTLYLGRHTVKSMRTSYYPCKMCSICVQDTTRFDSTRRALRVSKPPLIRPCLLGEVATSDTSAKQDQDNLERTAKHDLTSNVMNFFRPNPCIRRLRLVHHKAGRSSNNPSDRDRDCALS